MRSFPPRSVRERTAPLLTPTSMPIRFDASGRLDLSDWHTVPLEIIALRAVEELSRRDDHSPGFDLAKLQHRRLDDRDDH